MNACVAAWRENVKILLLLAGSPYAPGSSFRLLLLAADLTRAMDTVVVAGAGADAPAVADRLAALKAGRAALKRQLQKATREVKNQDYNAAVMT